MKLVSVLAITLTVTAVVEAESQPLKGPLSGLESVLYLKHHTNETFGHFREKIKCLTKALEIMNETESDELKNLMLQQNKDTFNAMLKTIKLMYSISFNDSKPEAYLKFIRPIIAKAKKPDLQKELHEIVKNIVQRPPPPPPDTTYKPVFKDIVEAKKKQKANETFTEEIIKHIDEDLKNMKDGSQAKLMLGALLEGRFLRKYEEVVQILYQVHDLPKPELANDLVKVLDFMKAIDGSNAALSYGTKVKAKTTILVDEMLKKTDKKEFENLVNEQIKILKDSKEDENKFENGICELLKNLDKVQQEKEAKIVDENIYKDLVISMSTKQKSSDKISASVKDLMNVNTAAEAKEIIDSVFGMDKEIKYDPLIQLVYQVHKVPFNRGTISELSNAMIFMEKPETAQKLIHKLLESMTNTMFLQLNDAVIGAYRNMRNRAEANGMVKWFPNPPAEQDTTIFLDLVENLIKDPMADPLPQTIAAPDGTRKYDNVARAIFKISNKKEEELLLNEVNQILERETNPSNLLSLINKTEELKILVANIEVVHLIFQVHPTLTPAPYQIEHLILAMDHLDRINKSQRLCSRITGRHEEPIVTVQDVYRKLLSAVDSTQFCKLVISILETYESFKRDSKKFQEEMGTLSSVIQPKAPPNKIRTSSGSAASKYSHSLRSESY